jgi:hypothetical protein
MNEMDVVIRNMSGYHDDFFNRLYDLGGMGVLRFGDEFKFLLLSDEGGYCVYSRTSGVPCLEKVFFPGGPHSARLIEKLAVNADQLFHLKYNPFLNISGIMLGAEQTILMYYPPKRADPDHIAELNS